MIKLTIQQQAVLASAAAHPSGFATRPTAMKPAAAAKLAARLLEHKLAREVRAKNDGPVWREDEQGRAFSLKLLKAGRELVAVLPSSEQAVAGTIAVGQTSEGTPATAAEHVAAPPVASSAAVIGTGQTKRTMVLALLARQEGATLAELVAMTGWLPHTTRAALSGLRKRGITLERTKRGDGASAYRAATPASAAATAA